MTALSFKKGDLVSFGYENKDRAHHYSGIVIDTHEKNFCVLWMGANGEQGFQHHDYSDRVTTHIKKETNRE